MEVIVNKYKFRYIRRFRVFAFKYTRTYCIRRTVDNVVKIAKKKFKDKYERRPNGYTPYELADYYLEHGTFLCMSGEWRPCSTFIVAELTKRLLKYL